jgi:hypothetical protein
MTGIISRADARATRLKHYFTGNPCKNGHVAKRLVSTRTCTACAAERQQTPEFRASAASYRREPGYRARMAGYERKYKTGMPDNVYHQKLIEQAGLCAVCNCQMMDGGTLLNTDRDHHQPGIYRDLLCQSCNVGLGYVEKPGWLHRALAYIEEHTWAATAPASEIARKGWSDE